MKLKFYLYTLMFLIGCASFLSSSVEAALVTLNSGQSATSLYDGASSSPACELCDASVTLTFNGNSLSSSLYNTSTDGVAGVNVFTQFAFDSTPNLQVGSATFGGSATTWQFKTTGLGSFEFGADTSNSINPGLEGGQTGTVVVPITSPSGLQSLAIDETQTHFQSINTPGGSSTKPQGCLSGATDCGSAPLPPTVPKPSTLILLGIGLLASRMVLKKLGTRNAQFS